MKSVSKFNREFDVPTAEKALLAPENAWFKDLLGQWRPAGGPQGEPGEGGDPDAHLRLAIRDGYLNFYRAGQSVAKVSFARGHLRGQVHNKYVYGHEGRTQEYVRLADGGFRNLAGSRVPYSDNLVREWILNANRYVEEEKRFVDRLISCQPGVIDVEAGLPADRNLWNENSAPRMDMVTVEPCSDHYRLAFWEIKLVDNREARCGKPGEPPKVVGQLNKYARWLAENRRVVCDAYRRCCSDLVKLHSLARRWNPAVAPLDSAIVGIGQQSAPLCIDSTPRLIIDATEGEGVFVTRGHLRKLQDFGICVRMARTPADLVMSAHA